jgi:hypothetical protein
MDCYRITGETGPLTLRSTADSLGAALAGQLQEAVRALQAKA